MNTKESKLPSHTQLGETAKSNRHSGETVTITTPIPGTPFIHIKNTESGNEFLTLGKYRISGLNTSLQEARKMIDEKEWDFLITVISALVDHSKNI